MNVAGKWALVTGASGGLGFHFAALLAERGANLILVARSAERLAVAATELSERCGVQVKPLCVDLSEESAAATLYDRIQRMGLTVDILVNNAGRGLHGELVRQSSVTVEEMLRLNMIGLTILTQAIARDMEARASGHILIVASLTSFMPCPTYAVYSASKAYVRHFGESLHAELKPRGVFVTVLSPGLMDTGFLAASGQRPTRSMKRSMTSPRLTAQIGLDAMFRGRQSVVAGRMNQIVAILSRLIPRGTQTRLMAKALNG